MMKRGLVIGVIVTVCLAAAFTIGTRLSREAEPRVREELERWLSDRLNSDVAIGALDVQFRPVLKVEGRDLVLRLKNRPDLPPFITISRLSGHGGFTKLSARRLDEVRIEGVEIIVPPGRKADLKDLREAGRTDPAPAPAAAAVPPPPFVIERLVTSAARVTVMPRDPGRDALAWDIRDVVMEPFTFDAATPFSATIDTPLPKDRAGVKGTLGPWPRGDFASLPFAAEYLFAGDVGALPGLEGKLEASGAILGTLDSLATNGTVSSPGIGLRGKDTGRLAMRSEFEAVLDGTNGDLFLTKVVTTLAESVFETSGKVLRVPGQRGRHITLAVKTPTRADIGDVMRLLVDGGHPPLLGRFTLNGTLDLPPGDTDLLQRLSVEGRFGLSRARFTNAESQAKVDELSRRGQGKPGETSIAKVPVDMRGTVRLRRHQLSLPAVVFSTEGATIDASGSYGLTSEQLRFRGIAKLDATLSRTLTGVRRYLLRPIDPLLKKQGAGTRLVIDVRGTRAAPVVDLDVGASLKGKK